MNKLPHIFAEINKPENRKVLETIAIWCILTVVFTFFAKVIPSDAPFAFDWNIFFKDGNNVPAFYPPWTNLIVSQLSYPLLIGVTLATFSVAVLLRTSSLPSSVIAFINLPLFWVIFLGQLDGIALLGAIGLPWLLPLALMKPQIASFAIFAKRSTMKLAAVFMVITFMIWKIWPLNMLTYHTNPAEEWHQDITLGWLGIPLFILLLVKMPKNDVDWWMLAGTTITPFLLPYNLLPLMPAIARLPIGWAIVAAISSWFPLLSNWTGPLGWYSGWVSILAIGFGLMSKAAQPKLHRTW